MTVEEAESYLREYNRYMMQILNIHEAIPGLSEEQGLALLMGDAFQQRAEAEGKWRRATLSQVQLSSYFAGFTEIFALREQLKKQKGDKFNLRQFHDEFLSFGSAPVKVIRQLMTDNKKES